MNSEELTQEIILDKWLRLEIENVGTDQTPEFAVWIYSGEDMDTIAEGWGDTTAEALKQALEMLTQELETEIKEEESEA